MSICGAQCSVPVEPCAKLNLYIAIMIPAINNITPVTSFFLNVFLIAAYILTYMARILIAYAFSMISTVLNLLASH